MNNYAQNVETAAQALATELFGLPTREEQRLTTLCEELVENIKHLQTAADEDPAEQAAAMLSRELWGA